MDPRPSESASSSLHWAERWVRVLDDGVRVPGTSFRFGLDAVLGLLLPAAGDVIAAVAGLSLIWAAIQKGAPRRVIAGMLLNIAIDALAGAIPIVGDLFDFGFKSNRRNLSLLEAHTQGAPIKTSVGVVGYALLGLATVFVLCALIIPMMVAVLLVQWLFG